jgi:hypothetical protein
MLLKDVTISVQCQSFIVVKHLSFSLLMKDNKRL